MHANTTAQDDIAADVAAHGTEWTERLVAANDYESMDPEPLDGLGCDAW